jgi:5-formyltetrahydrofolate cyclo-ligase
MTDDAERALRHGAKNMMRRRFRMLRRAVPRVALAQRSSVVCQRLLELPELRSARVVALFRAIARQHEVDLVSLDAALRDAGKQLAYPYIEPGAREMRFRLVVALDELAERGQGFAEPPVDAPELTEIDVIVVPGLAFDPRGHRIGYGAGFYDRALPRYRPPACAIGVAFEFQLAADLPNADHDVPVDRVVTDVRVLEVEAEKNAESAVNSDS